jgi:hypothetical protein
MTNARAIPCLLRSVLLAGLVALAGCKVASVEQSVVSQIADTGSPDGQMEFWHKLAEQPLTSNDDAFHGLLLYADGVDDSPDYASRVEKLKQRGMLPGSFAAPATEAVQRGTVAMAVLKLIGDRGGLMLTLLGPTPRYATRELIYLGLLPSSSPQQTFTGAQFVGVIGRIEDYQRGNPADKPAAELPGENANGSGNEPTTQPN